MTKWVRIVFLSSLALNVILIVGFMLFKKTISRSILKTSVLNTEARVTEARQSLHELETGDPNKIEALKLYLRESIEMGNQEAEEYRQAARK